MLEFGFPRVVVATGARWTTALSDTRSVPIPATFGGRALTPDDVMTGAEVVSPVVHATHAGHRLAREFDANVAPVRVERTSPDITV